MDQQRWPVQEPAPNEIQVGTMEPVLAFSSAQGGEVHIKKHVYRLVSANKLVGSDLIGSHFIAVLWRIDSE